MHLVATPVAARGERRTAGRAAVLTSSGWRHRASAQLGPLLVRQLDRTVTDFLAAQHVNRADLALIAMNPSDPHLLQVAERFLNLSTPSLAASTRVWEQHGNTLAVGPLHVLRTLGDTAGLADGALVLLVVLGPGITCDLLLVRWRGGLAARHLEAETGA
jgi:alkylresorcinol/alkylpyrone synthase